MQVAHDPPQIQILRLSELYTRVGSLPTRVFFVLKPSYNSHSVVLLSFGLPRDGELSLLVLVVYSQ